MTSQTKLTKDLIFKMVPQVTSKFNGRSKRALFPFVGDIASNLFWVATEGHVKVEWLRQVVKSCKPYFSYQKNKKKIKKNGSYFVLAI
jgi:hypothetical protein